MLRLFSYVRLFATLWTIVPQAPLSTEFSRQEYWSGLPFPSPGDLPDPGIKPMSLMSPALAGRFFTTSATLTGSPVKKPQLLIIADEVPENDCKPRPLEWQKEDKMKRSKLGVYK